MTKNLEDVRARLHGTWRLVSWQSTAADGTTCYPLGEDAVGQLMYDENGRVSAQLVRSGQHKFDSDDWREARVDERAAAWLNYFGYFGTFTVDTEQRAVTHHIESGWFPNLVGTQQVRYYHFDGPQLVLDADTAWGKVRIIWEPAS